MKHYLLTLFSCLLAAAAAADDLLPVEAFASLPDVSRMELSPDGKHTVSLVRMTGEGKSATVVHVHNIEQDQATYPLYASNEKFVINWVQWANNRYLLVSARFPATRYGVPTTETRLLSIDIESGKSSSVLSERFLSRQPWYPQFHDRIVDILPADENNILLALSSKSAESSGLIKVDVTKFRRSHVEGDRQHFVDWVTDRQNRVRIGIRREDTEYQIQHRAIDAGRWETLWEFESFAEDQVWPLGFDRDPNLLYVNAYHEGRLAIFKVDLNDAGLARELVFASPEYDVAGGLIYSHVKQAVIGTTFSEGGGYTFWDKEYQTLQRGIDKALPDTNNIVYSFSDDERRYIVLATSDSDAGSFYLGDRDEKSLRLMAYRYRALAPERMSPKQAIRYQARDGLTIEAYLTVPKGSGEDLLPAIVFPHGGPISFDDGGFDYWTQYFASRGYAVLQMNFRGSGGYGYDFMKAGLKNWGLEMQNDVEDGTRWLIEEGIADPERICIVGASYGGYAALMEAAGNPGLYRCAVSFAGVTDVADLVTSQRWYTNYEVVKEQVGSDLRALRNRSPLNLAERIDIPVLLAHGSKDRSVRVRHSRRMHRALEKADKMTAYVEFKDGDHYLSNEAHRLEFFRAMDAFLGEYLVL